MDRINRITDRFQKWICHPVHPVNPVENGLLKQS
jgi:hypothetical protein